MGRETFFFRIDQNVATFSPVFRSDRGGLIAAGTTLKHCKLQQSTELGISSINHRLCLARRCVWLTHLVAARVLISDCSSPPQIHPLTPLPFPPTTLME